MEKLRQIKDVRSLIEEFCEDCRLREMTEESIRRYRSSLLIFAEFLERQGISLESVPPRPSSTSPGCAPTASTRTKEVETQSKILRCPLLGQSVLFCGFSILRIYCVSNAWFAKFLLKFLRVSNYIRYKCVSRYKTLLIEDYDAYTFFAFSI
ncbi:MAG: hypothetical protein V6S10_00880 [Candidatus Methanoglobus sp.]